jgi:predicted enzyme related to lactoylglutathione lyase
VPNPVVHFEVVGKDAKALQDFFKTAFGWDVQPMMEGYAMAKPGGPTGINGGIGAAMGGKPGYVTFYIAVDDLAASLKKIESAGGRTVQGPMDIPNGPSIAMFADPEGHVIGLVKGM